MSNGTEVRGWIGGIATAPELRFSNNGKAWARMRLAFSRRVLVNGQWTNGESQYYTAKVFGQMAENLVESDLPTGTQVMVNGRLETDKWTAKDGTERADQVIVVDDLAVSLRFASAKATKATRTTTASTPQAAPVPAGAVDESPF